MGTALAVCVSVSVKEALPGSRSLTFCHVPQVSMKLTYKFPQMPLNVRVQVKQVFVCVCVRETDRNRVSVCVEDRECAYLSSTARPFPAVFNGVVNLPEKSKRKLLSLEVFEGIYWPKGQSKCDRMCE